MLGREMIVARLRRIPSPRDSERVHDERSAASEIYTADGPCPQNISVRATFVSRRPRPARASGGRYVVPLGRL